MSQAFNLSQLANKVNSSGKLDGTTGLTGTVTSSSSVIILGGTSGSITVSAPAVAGTTTLTLPASTGTVMVNGPAFSAYVGAAQSLTGFAFTKLALDTEEFDTNNNFDSTTNYRFTPTVAGYYQVNGNVGFNSVVNAPQLVISKNGSGFKNGSNPGTGNWSNVSALIYMNGSTDYIELFGAHVTSGSQSLTISNSLNYFQASLVRSA